MLLLTEKKIGPGFARAHLFDSRVRLPTFAAMKPKSDVDVLYKRMPKRLKALAVDGKRATREKKRREWATNNLGGSK